MSPLPERARIPQFYVGLEVKSRAGLSFHGHVRSCFRLSSGEWRYVVESTAGLFIANWTEIERCDAVEPNGSQKT